MSEQGNIDIPLKKYLKRDCTAGMTASRAILPDHAQESSRIASEARHEDVPRVPVEHIPEPEVLMTALYEMNSVSIILVAE